MLKTCNCVSLAGANPFDPGIRQTTAVSWNPSGQRDDKMAYIEIRELVKEFKEIRALDQVSLSFDQGQIHGIIGRNGSGKTVMLKCICGFMKPTSGEILVGGKKIVPGKRQAMGIIIEVPGFIDQKSGLKNLEYLYGLNHRLDRDKLKKTMEKVGLDPENKKPVGKYSLGMRQRLAIAQAIMEEPELLLLDEPMNGLDNKGVEDIRELLKKLAKEGKTIILASHSREDISLLCDTVTELDHGKIILTA